MATALNWVATQTSRTSAHKSAVTVAPFRAWRSSQHIVARGPEWVTIEGAYRSELARRSVATVPYSFHEPQKPNATLSRPLFAVIQLVTLTISVSVAFVLRNGSLKASHLELQAGLEAAEIAVAEAKTRSTEGAGEQT